MVESASAITTIVVCVHGIEFLAFRGDATRFRVARPINAAMPTGQLYSAYYVIKKSPRATQELSRRRISYLLKPTPP